MLKNSNSFKNGWEVSPANQEINDKRRPYPENLNIPSHCTAPYNYEDGTGFQCPVAAV
jgi:hypothetical protein